MRLPDQSAGVTRTTNGVKVFNRQMVRMDQAIAAQRIKRADVHFQARPQAAQPYVWKPTGFKAPGRVSPGWQGACQYGNDGITRCDECDIDWDTWPPELFCITAAICYDNNGTRIDCPW